MSFLWNLAIKYWRPIASFIAMAVFLGWISYQSHRIYTLTDALQKEKELNASYEASLKILESDAAAKIKAIEEESQREIQRTENKERLLGRIEGASDDEDADVAPVLRGAIDRLYRRTENAD